MYATEYVIMKLRSVITHQELTLCVVPEKNILNKKTRNDVLIKCYETIAASAGLYRSEMWVMRKRKNNI
jgi:uncharacterized protein YbcI